jgi:hemolysin activation/secretion protein
VTISRIVIVGNESISEKEILSQLNPYLERPLDLKAIYEMCGIIERLYAKEGYFLTRAYPPPQTIENGVLTIKVIEGCLGSITIVGNKYYSESFILGYFSSLSHKPLQEKKFLRALMLLNENSDLMAGAIFEKGKEFGCADVIIHVKDSRPLHLYLNGNNYGRFLTTNARAGGRFDWGNVCMQGDKLSIAEVVGFPVNALYFTDAIYRFPLNKSGSSLELAYLFSRFKVEELTQLHLKGQSNIATLKFNQALTRTRTLSVDFFTYFDYKQVQNFTLGERVSFDKLRVLTVGTLLDHFQPMQGRDYLTIQFAAGIPDFLGGLKAVDSESSRKGGGGRFFILTADYDRIQHLPWDSFLYLHASGQLTPNKLTLPEQIYIGGIDTVRGFPLAVAVGDSGYYLNFEFRIPPPFIAEKKFFCSKKKWKDVFQFDAFIDHGGAFLQSITNIFLWGTGVGARLNGPYGLSFSIDVGFALNHRNLTTGAFTYIKLTGQPF